jgi:uncharacterized membrane protein
MSITTASASRVASRRSRDRLDLPAPSRVTIVPRAVNREAVNRSAERIARFLGTGRYLAIQSVLVLVWIALNIALPFLRWDPYPFILLNLAFSTQAAYAAPLILLAQNRQDDRDRATLAEDRAGATRIREDTEFLAREIAALRLSYGDAATRQYVRGELSHQLDSLRDDLRDLVSDAVRSAPAGAPVVAGAGPGALNRVVAASPGTELGAAGPGRLQVPNGATSNARKANRAAGGRSGTGRGGSGHRPDERRRRAPAGLGSATLLSPGCQHCGEPRGTPDPPL